MNLRISIVFAALALAACGAPKSKEAAADETAPAAASEAQAPIKAERELFDRNAGHPELTPEQKIGGAEGRSPFVGDRVVKLNAIVRRSLDVSREFDDAAPGIRAAVDAAAAGGDRAAAESAVKKIGDFHDRAKAALDDMVKAEADLKESGEYYDDSIFAGMMKFVADIESELRDEKSALEAKLGN